MVVRFGPGGWWQARRCLVVVVVVVVCLCLCLCVCMCMCVCLSVRMGIRMGRQGWMRERLGMGILMLIWMGYWYWM